MDVDDEQAQPDQAQPEQTDDTPAQGGGQDTDPRQIAVNAPQPQQQELPDPTVGQTIPGGDQQPAQVPLVLHEAPHSGFRGVLDRVLDAIAGKQDSQIYRDDQGNEYVQHPDLSAGQKWARVADMALTGAAQGLANGRGAGNGGKALLAGVQAGSNIRGSAQQVEQQNQAEVKRNRLDQANYNLLTQKMLENQFALTRMQQDANDHDKSYVDAQIAQEDALKSIPLGTYKGISDLPQLKQQHPEVLKDFYNTKNVVVIPHIDPETGKHDGATFYLRRPGVTDQILPPGTPFHVATLNDKGDYELKTQTSTEPMKQSEIDQYNLAAHTMMGNQAKEKADLAKENMATAASAAEIPLRQAQTKEAQANTAKSYAEARKASVESAAAGNMGDDAESQAQALADGRTAPSLLNKRTKDYNAIMRRANEISIQQTGQPFNQEQAEIHYQARKKLVEDYATGPAAQSIESFDRFLGHAQDASESVQDIRNTNSRLLNVPFNKLALLTGSERSAGVVKMMADAETARKEWQTVLANNHALTNDDKKIGKTIMDENSTPAQMQSALREFAKTAAVRLRASDFTFLRTTGVHVPDLISGDGQRALQHFGIDPQSVYATRSGQQQPQQQQRAVRPQTSQPPPPGATNEVHQGGPSGPLIGHIVNGQYVPLNGAAQ